ncbi:MAG: cytochrome c biogenesis protein CcdA [Candidatus Methanoperedens sp.]|nr:cytochrome c biogenesis protein CcdA [Candidatus Methanoperedens sp.]
MDILIGNVSLDTTFPGFFLFGILAGLCPCNSVLCLALMGYVTGDNKAERRFHDAILLTLPFGLGTLLVITLLGGIAAFLGKSIVLFDERIAYALGGMVLFLMAIQLFGIYHLPVKKIFMSLRLPPSTTPLGTFLLGLSFGAITMGRVAPMLFAVLAVAAVSGSVAYGLTISLLFGTGMVLPLVIISSIGGAAGKTIRTKLEEKGVLIDRALGIILILASIYFFYLALK